MYDLIVIGAGAVGSATAYHAAKAGRRVLLLEQFEINHQRGSSYGYSRIIRYAYNLPAYVDLMRAAYPAWHAFEQDSGETIYTKTGGIDFAPAGEASLHEVIDALVETGIEHEVMSGTEARGRFPQFQFDDDMEVLYQADAGVLRASKSVAAHVRMARQYGADVRDTSPVTAITPTNEGVEVTAGGETYQGAKLVIASGAWVKAMVAALGVHLPLQSIAPQEVYFQPLEPAQFTTDVFPVFIAHNDSTTGIGVYGLPSVDGSGVKIALHDGPPIDPNSSERTPDQGVVDLMHQFAERYLPQAAGELALTRVCLYTMSPDQHFIIDKHPTHPQIVIASCCSGHAFKFSTLLGSILSDFALTGETQHDISLFSLSRFEGVQS